MGWVCYDSVPAHRVRYNIHICDVVSWWQSKYMKNGEIMPSEIDKKHHKCKVHDSLKKEAKKLLVDLNKRGFCITEMSIILHLAGIELHGAAILQTMKDIVTEVSSEDMFNFDQPDVPNVPEHLAG